MTPLLSEAQCLQIGMITLIISLFFYVGRTLSKAIWVRELGFAFLGISSIALIGSLALRSLNAQYFALSNMYESMLVLIIWMQIAFLVIDRWFKPVGLGWPVCLLMLVSLIYDTTLPTTIAPLQAALQSYWRSIHVPVIILSYAMFALSFISALVYLAQSYFPGKGGVALATQGLSPTEGISTELAQAVLHQSNASRDTNNPLQSSGSPSTGVAVEGFQLYDEITYRCIALGFPLLTIGIILGALWANEAWGNYWSWDPKESMSLVTLLGYGVYLHLRVNGEHSKRTLAWVSVIGFALMLITYFGVNLMGLGLHSYGKIG